MSRDPFDDELALERAAARAKAATETDYQRRKRRAEFAREATASEFGRARRRRVQP